MANLPDLPKVEDDRRCAKIFNPQHITDMPAVKFFVGLDLNPIGLFPEGQ